MAAEAVANAMTDANRMFFMDLPGFERTPEKPLKSRAVPRSRQCQAGVIGPAASNAAAQQKAARVTRRGFVD
ncbi:hypothetical protein [Mesorhizobium sp. M0227]|uniref:hypothetical protein n=1 Tax=unclassified Mesorhizobium TaxID=325217 RepID=UPI0033355732